MTFPFEILSRLTCKNIEWNIVRDNYSNLDPFQNINIQADVSPGFTNVNEREDFRKLTNFLPSYQNTKLSESLPQ